ncbi:hypothetical protein [Pediococcus pentosaceus]|uniref:hypothetical protein n=1 Tax=Pediococcus pentosaceus TaxID=1255 RepID=UPI0010443CB9|nr:hypothetical protein [Pediococcus pentosaceus]
MKLVRISEDAIIDIDDVQFAIWDDEDQKVKIEFKSTNTYLYTKDQKVLDTICGKGEQDFIGYKRLKNKDLIQKAYVDVNNICGSEEHSVEYEDAENYRRDKD